MMEGLDREYGSDDSDRIVVVQLRRYSHNVDESALERSLGTNCNRFLEAIRRSIHLKLRQIAKAHQPRPCDPSPAGAVTRPTPLLT